MTARRLNKQDGEAPSIGAAAAAGVLATYGMDVAAGLAGRGHRSLVGSTLRLVHAGSLGLARLSITSLIALGT